MLKTYLETQFRNYAQYSNQEFNNVQDLKTCTLGVGMKTYVKGIKQSYTIVQSTTEEIDDIFVVALNNGLYAKLNYTADDMISVLVAGITPNSKIADKLNTLSVACVGRVKGIQFGAGTYLIDKPIMIKSINYAGEQNQTILKVADDFSVASHTSILITQAETGTDIFSYTLRDLHFVCDIAEGDSIDTYAQEHTSVEYCMFKARNTVNSVFYNCVFEVKPSENSGKYLPFDLLWFKDTDNLRNVEIKNCKFIHKTALAFEGNGASVGGCVWMNGRNYTLNSENVLIDNCSFEFSTFDEAFVAWKGNYKNIVISNCNFKTLAESNTINMNTIAFNDGHFEDCKVLDSNFDLRKVSQRLIKTDKPYNGSDFLFKGLKIETNYQLDSRTGNPALALFTYQTAKSVAETNGINKVNIENCDIKVKEGSYYNQIFQVINHSVEFNVKNCNIEYKLSQTELNSHWWGVLECASASNQSITLDGNTIDNDNKYIIGLGASSGSKFRVINNALNGAITNMFKNGATNDVVEFNDNYITSNSHGYLFTTDTRTELNDKINVTADNNHFFKEKKDIEDYLFVSSTIAENKCLILNKFDNIDFGSEVAIDVN